MRAIGAQVPIGTRALNTQRLTPGYRRLHRGPSGRLARGLGWFSLCLGATLLAAPGTLARATGLPARNGLARLIGLREVAAGVGILTGRDPTVWMWARAAGDAMDAGLLAQRIGPAAPGRALGAFAAVVALGVLDSACALALGRKRQRAQGRVDYGDRSGFPHPPAHMRGMASAAAHASGAR
jgi:hypothetical protein